MVDTKECRLCRVGKPLESFHKDPSRRDGHHDRCKLCRGCRPRDFLPTAGLRRCTKCLEIKIEDEHFSFRDRAKGARVAACKSCVNKASNAWYVANRVRHNAIGKVSRASWGVKIRDRNKALLVALKAKPCVDCATEYPPWVIQFDHLDSTKKKGNLSSMAHNCATEAAILREADKCEVVCANCHMNRTHMRRSE